MMPIRESSSPLPLYSGGEGPGVRGFGYSSPPLYSGGEGPGVRGFGAPRARSALYGTACRIPPSPPAPLPPPFELLQAPCVPRRGERGEYLAALIGDPSYQASKAVPTCCGGTAR